MTALTGVWRSVGRTRHATTSSRSHLRLSRGAARVSPGQGRQGPPRPVVRWRGAFAGASARAPRGPRITAACVYVDGGTVDAGADAVWLPVPCPRSTRSRRPSACCLSSPSPVDVASRGRAPRVRDCPAPDGRRRAAGSRNLRAGPCVCVCCRRCRNDPRKACPHPTTAKSTSPRSSRC